VVNVHIHQFKPGGAVVDAAALAQFQEQGATYRKLITSNCLCHREVGSILRDTLNAMFASPFTFLDIACGDASVMKTALRGPRSAIITASISRNPRSSSPPPISRGRRSKSISTIAISWTP
jgi:hypothetical protein